MKAASPEPHTHRQAASAGFDFTAHVRALCEDMVSRVDALSHVRMEQVAIGFRQTRNRTSHGMHACLTGLRFAGGREWTVRRGRKWGIQKLRDPSGREMLYILEFYLPRFLDQPRDEKLLTVVHELWHVSPHFNGDVRRHDGRCYVHGTSQKHYDDQVRRLVRRWLAAAPDLQLFPFLHHDFHGLVDRFGPVHGLRFPAPKLIPLD